MDLKTFKGLLDSSTPPLFIQLEHSAAMAHFSRLIISSGFKLIQVPADEIKHTPHSPALRLTDYLSSFVVWPTATTTIATG